jgi:SAM-dependent methyltransferase
MRRVRGVAARAESKDAGPDLGPDAGPDLGPDLGPGLGPGAGSGTEPAVGAVPETGPPAGPGAGDPGFDPARLARIRELEGWHFWFAGRRELVRGLLARHLGPAPQRILDVGCGTGRLAGELLAAGHRVTAVDRLPEALAAARAGTRGVGLLRADAGRLPLRAGAFDAVTLLDVLEHVDDAAALAELRRVVRPGGLLVLTVPAAPWLWSHRDRAAGHLRRYTRTSLRAALAAGGFAPLELGPYQCALFPVLAASRLFGRRGPRLRDAEERPPALLNAALAWVNRREARLGPGRLPFGSSLAAACRRSA